MATAEVGALRVTLAMNAGEFQRGAREAETVMDRLGSRARQLGFALGGAFVVGQFASWATAAMKAAGDAEAALATVEAIIKSTGGAAGLTSERLVAMAQELKALTNIDDDKILRDVTANLLTFTNVVGPVFKEAQVAAINLSAVLRQDLQSSTIQLGKALNDPIKGITALRRVGVAFTNSQREQIKTLLSTGDILSAQRIILKELAKEFGGAAEAQAKTIEGRINKVTVAFGDALEYVGKAMERAGFLDLAEGVANLAKSFGDLSPRMQTIIAVAGGVTAALVAIGAVAGTVALIFGSFALPFVAAAAVIGTSTGIIIAYWDKIKIAALSLSQSFSSIYASVKDYLGTKLTAVIDESTFAFQGFSQNLSIAAGSIRNSLSFLTGPIVAIYQTVKTFLYDRMAPLIDAIIEKFNQLKSVVFNVWDAFKSLTGMSSTLTEEQTKLLEGFKKTQQQFSEARRAVADQAAAEAEEQAQKLALANVRAAAVAEAAAQKQTEALKKQQEEQKKLIEQGVRLAEQIRSPTEIMLDNQKKIQAAFDAGKISVERYGNAMQQAAYVSMNAYATMASGIAASLQQAFTKSKAVAIAVALINTYEAVTKALAAYPPPFNYVAAAAALAAGLVQVANIRKTTKESSGGGGGGSSAAAVNPNAGGGPGDASQVLTVRGLAPGTMMSSESVRDLAQRLLQYQRDGGQVVLQ